MENKSSKKVKSNSKVNVKSSQKSNPETTPSKSTVWNETKTKRTPRVSNTSTTKTTVRSNSKVSKTSTPNTNSTSKSKVTNTWSSNTNTQPSTPVENRSNIKESNGTNNKPTYTYITKYIYSTGTSYRVRVSINGKLVSVTATSKKEAFQVRKRLLEMRGN